MSLMWFCFIHQARAGPEKVGQKENICNLSVQGASPLTCA